MLLTAISCKQKIGKDGKAVETDGGDKVYSFSRENKDMNAAIAEAIKTYPEFERIVANPGASETDFSVKMHFEYDGGNEHMWLNDLHFKNGRLYGILDSEPMYIENLQPGDTLPINKGSVSDWFYAKNGKLIGGYTIRVVYNNLGEEDKIEFEKSFPFEFE
jgi:uncharacterized protein YegJ (DUF2314 family)